jgi:hypothetical protein
VATTNNEGQATASDDLEKRFILVVRLTRLFQPERIVHLSVTSISLIMLLASAGSLLIQGKAGSAELTGLFGSSGIITYTAGRLLAMWSQALRVLVGESGGRAK